MAGKIDVLQLLSVCADVAERASVILHDVAERGDNKKFSEKTGPTDLVTIADGQAQALIIGTLSKHFPKLKIVGEESDSPSDNVPFGNLQKLESFRGKLVASKFASDIDIDKLVVYVDPLDGTKEYTDGIYDAVTILIGIASEGVPIAGVVYEPWGGSNKKGNLVWGLVGFGAEGLVQGPVAPFEDLRICTTRSHNNPLVDGGIEKLGVPPSRVIRCGGAGRKVLMVARGEAECYLYPTAGTNKWDTCAPEAILRALGGQLSDKFGRNLDYKFGSAYPNSDGIIVTISADYHKRIIQILNGAKQ